MATDRVWLHLLCILAAFAALHLAADQFPRWIGLGVFVVGALVILGIVIATSDSDERRR